MNDSQAQIDDLIASVRALDQSLLHQMQTSNDLRKQIVIRNICFDDLNKQIQSLLEENKALKDERDTLQKSMHSLASEAQAIEG